MFDQKILQMIQQAGPGAMQPGTPEHENLLNALAAMGPPPQLDLPQAQPLPQVGAALSPAAPMNAPKLPPMTRGEAATGGSIGSMLGGY